MTDPAREGRPRGPSATVDRVRQVSPARALCYRRAVPRASQPLLRAAVAAGVGAVVVLAASPARAETSAWTTVGGGALALKHDDESFATYGTMDIDLGVGTSPAADYMVGGLFRLKPIFEQGLDLSFSVRGANYGFQAGPLGLAVDLGAYARPWGVGSVGFAGGLVLGLPLGLQLSGQGMVGTRDALAFGGTLGLDLLRLTIYRQHLLDWWPNPSPPQAPGGPVGFAY